MIALKTKPPKLRFKPGSIIQNIRTKELFCIRVIYRTTESPHEWRFVIETRKDMAKPSDKLSPHIENLLGPSVNQSIVIYDPLSLSRRCGVLPGIVYWYGDCENVSNKSLMNEFLLISSGEVS